MTYALPPEVRKDQQGWTGKFYERTLQQQVFCFGSVSTALVANNATATTLSATAKPLIGLFNPPSSGKNLIVMQTAVLLTAAAASTVLPGAFVWVYATAAAITTGTAGIGRFIQATQTPSVGLAFAGSTALTSLSGNLTNTNVPLAVGTVATAQPATATSMASSPFVEANEGSWIIAPGCFLGVMNTVSTTTVSVATSIVWAELDVTG